MRLAEFERLIRDSTDRDRLGPQRNNLPILLLWGSDDAKSRLLQDLQGVDDWPGPRAFLDCGRLDGLRPHEIAYRIAFRLGLATKGFGRARFPRLFLGLTVIRQKPPPADQFDDVARRRNIKRLFRNRYRLRRTVRNSIKALGMISGLRVMERSGVLDLLVDLILAAVGQAGRLQRGAQWYRTAFGPGVADTVDALAQLQGYELEEDHVRVDKVLCRAFLDDLDAAYRRRARWWFTRRINAVVLLDDVQDESVRKFLTTLIEERSVSGPLLVVAASDRRYPEEAQRYQSEWQPDPLAEALVTRWTRNSRYYPVDAAPVLEVLPTSGSPRSKVAAVAQHFGIGEEFFPLVAFAYRLTAAHPTGLETVLDTLRIARALPSSEIAPSPFDRRTTLSCPTPSGAPLDEHVLELVADGWPLALRRALVLMALAVDLSDANLDPIRAAHPGLGVQITEFLDADLWVIAESGGPRRLHPFVRRAIAHLLGRTTIANVPSTWESAHERLRAAAEDRGDLAAMLYHDLALGRVHDVATRLSAEYKRMAREDWYRLLVEVTAAPLRRPDLAGGAEDHLDELCASEKPEPPVTRRLVAAMQLHTDPLADPRHQMCPIIANQLVLLGGGSTFLNTQSGTFRNCPKEMASGGQPVAEPEPRRSRPRRLWRDHTWFARGTALLLVIGVLALLAWLFGPPLIECAPGVAKVDDECIGITDGTVDAALGASTAVPLKVIGEENARLDAEHPHDPTVTVAFVIPVPRPGGNAELARSLAHDLMGAAVAQRQANRTSTDGNRPFIRLLVANIGDSSARWKAPVSKLIDMVHDASDPRRVTAVGVSGWSLEPIGEAIDALVAADVPVITGRLTADQLTSKPVTSDLPMVRVAPSNSAQAQAAAAYLRPTTKRALIVQDVNPDDYYAKNLGDRFRVSYPDAGHTLLEPPEVYDGNKPDVPNAMTGILRNICVRKPDVVFFTGRPEHLAAFVGQLPFRPCPDLPVRVMTGSAANTFAAAVAGSPGELGTGMRANASVTFTALAHPKAWEQPSPVFKDEWHSYLNKPCDAICFPTLFRAEPLDDGAVIMGYDVMRVAVHAIRATREVSSGAVIQQFKQMHGVGAFPGASGVFSFSAGGDPINKPTPILSVLPDGAIKFEQVSYPNTTPCIPDSTYC